MPYRTIVYLTAAAILGLACITTEALAYRGIHRAGNYRGQTYRGGYVRPGVGAGVTPYYNSACDDYPSCDPAVGTAAWARAHDY